MAPLELLLIITAAGAGLYLLARLVIDYYHQSRANFLSRFLRRRNQNGN